MGLSRAYLIVALGLALATFGLYLIYVPLALLFGGACMTAGGLLTNLKDDDDATS